MLNLSITGNESKKHNLMENRRNTDESFQPLFHFEAFETDTRSFIPNRFSSQPYSQRKDHHVLCCFPKHELRT